MNCPKCGREMEPGYLSAGGYSIKWTPKERTFSGYAVGGRETELQGTTFTGKNRVKAQLCRACRTAVLEY